MIRALPVRLLLCLQLSQSSLALGFTLSIYAYVAFLVEGNGLLLLFNQINRRKQIALHRRGIGQYALALRSLQLLLLIKQLMVRSRLRFLIIDHFLLLLCINYECFDGLQFNVLGPTTVNLFHLLINEAEPLLYVILLPLKGLLDLKAHLFVLHFQLFFFHHSALLMHLLQTLILIIDLLAYSRFWRFFRQRHLLELCFFLEVLTVQIVYLLLPRRVARQYVVVVFNVLVNARLAQTFWVQASVMPFRIRRPA